MQQVVIIIFLFCVGICRGQSPVLHTFNNQNYGATEGAYYKDIDNDFNKFAGTWLYTNGTTSFKITLQKVNQVYRSSPFNYYEDLLIGEYRYIENGVEKVNTLPQLTSGLGAFTHNIVGNIINLGINVPACDDCTATERRVILGFRDPTRSMVEGLRGQIIFTPCRCGYYTKDKVMAEANRQYYLYRR